MLALIASSAIATIFFVSGVAKLSRPKEFQTNLVAFGVPSAAAPLVALGLPTAEIVAGGALVFPRTAQIGALFAAGLLILFTSSIGYQLSRGRTPDCQCCGEMRARPISYWTLLRNVVLLSLASYVATPHQASSISVPGWLHHMTYLGLATLGVFAALFAVAGFETLVIAQLVRSHGQVLLRLDALEGSRPGHLSEPTSPLATNVGETVTLDT